MSKIFREIKAWQWAFSLWAPGQLGDRLRKAMLSKTLKFAGGKLKVAPSTWWNGCENITLGDNISVGRGCIFESSAGTISIGNNTAFNSNCTLGADFGSISIGSDVNIGMNTVMRAANHRFDMGPKVLIREQGHIGGEIIIEDDVWIGANVTILAGVRIGSHSVIGAGAVVTSDIEECSLAIGIPAKTVKLITD